MQNNTDPSNTPRFRHRAIEGDLVEVDGAATVVVRLTPERAYDLAKVLDNYTRMVDVVTRSSEVSGTETSLARALSDAATTVRTPL